MKNNFNRMSFRYLNGWFEVKNKFHKIAVGKKGTAGLFFLRYGLHSFSLYYFILTSLSFQHAWYLLSVFHV